MTRTTVSTSQYIIAQLAKYGIKGALADTGGGCTAVLIELPKLGTNGETAHIVITDSDGSQAILDGQAQAAHVGWLVGFYPDDDSYMYGENVTYVHGAKFKLPNDQVNVPLVAALDENDEPIIGYDGQVIMLPSWPLVDWRADAKALAVNVANFVADLRDSRD